MCLSVVNQIYPLNDKTVGYGWKLFEKENGKLYPEMINNDIAYPINRWIKSVHHIIYINPSSVYYNSGFHIFKTRKAARIWKEGSGDNTVIRKVKYRGIICEGIQLKNICYVTKEMMIIE